MSLNFIRLLNFCVIVYSERQCVFKIVIIIVTESDSIFQFRSWKNPQFIQFFITVLENVFQRHILNSASPIDNAVVNSVKIIN
jgi:hypothetical protein